MLWPVPAPRAVDAAPRPPDPPYRPHPHRFAWAGGGGVRVTLMIGQEAAFAARFL